MKTNHHIIRDVLKPLLGRGWGGLIITMMLSSCVNDIPYDAEIGAPKLVLNAMLRANGEQFTATVGRTAHFLDTEEPQRLSDATVTATINGEDFTLVYDEASESYLSYYGLNAGDEVTLTAVHALGTATATERVVEPTPITIVNTTMQPFTPPGDPLSAALLNDVDSALLVSLYINDPAEEANYYRLSIHYEGNYEVMYPEDIYTEQSPPLILPRGEDAGITDSTLPLWGNKRGAKGLETFYPHYLFTESSTALLTTSESMSQMFSGLLYMSSTNSFIFTDEHLHNADGQPIVDFLFLLESPASSDDMFNPESGWDDGMDEGSDYIYPADTVSSATYHYAFMLERLSEDYYKYLEDVAAFEMTGGAFVGEPLPIHTNIRGGLGIVGSYSTTECSGDKLFELSKEEQ